MSDTTRIEQLRRRVQADPASFAFAALAEEYRKAGKYDAAIETCRAGLGRHPSYVSARATLGRALLDVGRVDDAGQEFTQVLAAAPENLIALRGLAETCRRAGQPAHAIEYLRRAATLAPLDRELADAVAEVAREMAAMPPAPERPFAVAEPPPVAAPPSVVTTPDPPLAAEPEPWLAAPPARSAAPEPGQRLAVQAPSAPQRCDAAAAADAAAIHHAVAPSSDPAALDAVAVTPGAGGQLAALERFLAVIERHRAERRRDHLPD